MGPQEWQFTSHHVSLLKVRPGLISLSSHGHKNNIIDLKWNKNGNWMASVGRDQVVKLFDIRMMKEFASLKGHSKEINSKPRRSPKWPPLIICSYCLASNS